ncbi:ParA family protein [Synechocystis sp. LEGE 06083]|uniref:ParA family protein n=1 Tax=Synechocystis sp. LEGE 06083 TaxID=915336 RepID=UPI001881078F|nr:ParA family protein [Synechocystis sp. LEGE 06083]MBE9194352.1 ParA family protein [Synechocystis sp. LEGE 06083]
MSKTIAIVSRKGGVGKSTLCANLAVVARDATILDCDDQASLADWGDRRGNNSPLVIAVPPRRTISTLEKATTDWNFIDTPGTLDAGIIEVMQASDFILVVLRYGQFDLDSVSTTLSAVRLSQKPAAIVLNLLHPKTKSEDLIANLEDAQLGYPISPHAVCSRADFQQAAAQGRGVTELDQSSKASHEIRALWQWLQQQV